MKRFTWQEMKELWTDHANQIGSIDYEKDPGGLQNVCIPSEPLWLNQFHDTIQTRVFDQLVPLSSQSGSSALDVGCGAGRWCSRLSALGYAVTGIDLQSALIEENRRRFPNMNFYHSAIQDFNSPAPFDLVTSVTVIQHIPFEEQPAAVASLRRFLKQGGHLLTLDNTIHHLPNVFPHSVRGWIRLYEAGGFKLKGVLRYDYSPSLRLHEPIQRVLRKSHKVLRIPGDFNKSTMGRINSVLKFAAVRADLTINKGLSTIRLPFGSRHCGILLEAI